MSGTLLHTAIAAGVGLTVGISATLALSKPSSRPTPPTTAPPSSPTAPAPAAPRPGQPPVVYNGGLTSIVSPYIQPASIGPISDFLARQAYVTAYDRRNRIPAWTAEHLTAANLRRPAAVAATASGESASGGGDRQNSVFKEDESIPYAFRAHLLDYFKSGYDRGHMVPAADAKRSQQAMDETFLLTNIAPQVGDGFNRHYWAYVEAFVRNLTASFEDVYVFTVPLFLPKRFPDGKFRVTYEMIAPQGQPPSIAVPTHFAKVVLASRPRPSLSHKMTQALTHSNNNQGRDSSDKEWSLGAFVLPNEPIPDEARLTQFVVPVESVERSSGLSLFPDSVKGIARPLCESTKCEVVVRRFDDAQRRVGAGTAAGQGGNGGGATNGNRSRSGSIVDLTNGTGSGSGGAGHHYKKPGPGLL